MPTRNKLFSGLIFMVLLLSACQPLPVAPPSVDGADTPAYAARGPLHVGFRTFVSTPAGQEPVKIHAWYPAAAADNATVDEATIKYEVTLKDATWSPTTPPIANGHALRDADVNRSEGPYPLVVLSHGFMLSPAWYHTIAEHLTSHGFIVLAPDHVEEFDPTFGEMWKTLIDRPTAVTQTIDYAEALTAPEGEMADTIDMENVAVIGHSYGGYTALAAAGAQYDMTAYKERCAALAEDDPLVFFCMPIVPNEVAMAERAGLSEVSDGLWPSFGDSRVTAIVPMAGDSYLFDEAGLSQITVPMMAITGGADTGTPVDWGAQPAYEYAASEDKSLVILEGGEHMIFTTPCENQPWISEHPYHEYFCFDPAWEKTQALDLIHHYTTAFLHATLNDDQAARSVLSQSNAPEYPGIQYETTLQ